MPVTIQDVERLIDKFKWERYLHLILIGLCSLIIIVVCVILVFKGDIATAISLLVPGGAIFGSLSRVFKMWDDVM